MKTPICDFVQKYQQSGAERLHMPGHKGQSHLGYEPFDLTEIDGADSLFSANGIIAQSAKPLYNKGKRSFTLLRKRPFSSSSA